jgi:azurin
LNGLHSTIIFTWLITKSKSNNYPIMKLTHLFSIAALLLFMGCGGSGEEQQQQAEESADDGVRTIEIIGIDDMKFVVEEEAEGIEVGDETGGYLLLETITAEPGEEIRIRLTTDSELPASAMSHNWVLLDAEANVEAFARDAARASDNAYIDPEREDDVLAHTDMIGGEDEPTTVTFTAPEEPGDYEFICSFPGHYAGGMKGVLTVTE